MGFGIGLWLIVLGVLGAANLIIAKKPDAAELIAKISPYQGWIGAISAIWGLWVVIWMIMGLGWIGSFPVRWILWMASGLVLLGLGLLLGVGVLKTFIKQPQAVEKLDLTVAKLAPYQGKLGLAGIGLGLLGFVFNFVPF